MKRNRFQRREDRSSDIKRGKRNNGTRMAKWGWGWEGRVEKEIQGEIINTERDN